MSLGAEEAGPVRPLSPKIAAAASGTRRANLPEALSFFALVLGKHGHQLGAKSRRADDVNEAARLRRRPRPFLGFDWIVEALLPLAVEAHAVGGHGATR